MEPEYKKEFFDALAAKVEKGMRVGPKCADCGVQDATKKQRPREGLSEAKAVVRLALINPSGPPNVASNIDFFCTGCRKPGAEWQKPHRIKPGNLPQLFAEVK